MFGWIEGMPRFIAGLIEAAKASPDPRARAIDEAHRKAMREREGISLGQLAEADRWREAARNERLAREALDLRSVRTAADEEAFDLAAELHTPPAGRIRAASVSVDRQGRIVVVGDDTALSIAPPQHRLPAVGELWGCRDGQTIVAILKQATVLDGGYNAVTLTRGATALREGYPIVYDLDGRYIRGRPQEDHPIDCVEFLARFTR